MVAGFKELLHDLALIRTSNELQGKRLGIEGQWFLKTQLCPASKAEPLLLHTGGPSLTLRDSLLRAVKQIIKACEVAPVFVFDGLAVQPFEHADDPPIFNVLRTLSECGAECIVAPYKAWAQLGYLLQTSQIDMVFGSLENVLFGDGAFKFLVEADFEAGKYSYIERNKLFSSLEITRDELLVACVSAGVAEETSSTSASLPKKKKPFAKCLEQAVQARNSGKTSLSTSVSPVYVALKHMCIMYAPCRVEPLGVADAPVDLYSVLGPRLPDFVYYFMLEGAISPSLLNVILSGRWTERQPSFDSLCYRKAINGVMDLRGRTLGLLVDGLHPSFVRQRIVLVRWFDPGREYVMRMKFEQRPLTYRLKEFGSDLPDNLKKVDLAFVIVHEKKSHSTRAGVSATNRAVLKTKLQNESEILYQVMAEGLRFMGYTKGVKLLSSEFPEASLLALELARQGSLHGNSLQLPSAVAVRACDANVAFLSRLASLLPCSSLERGAAWNGETDADLAGFSVVATLMARSIRDLLDVIALRLWLDRMAVAPIECVESVALKLPFASYCGNFNGLLVKELCLSPETFTLDAAKRRFPNICDLILEIRAVDRFFVKAFKSLKRVQGTNQEMLDTARVYWCNVLEKAVIFK